MTTTKAIYHPRNITVEIKDTFEMAGKTLAVIKARSGTPFADGAKTTTLTAYKTVDLEELEVCTCTPRDVMACHVCRQLIQEQYGDEIPY